MADGHFRFPQGGGHFYNQYNQQTHHQRHIAQRPGSPISRIGFNATDTPSPTRSPGPQSPAQHNPFGMYNQHQQGQHGFTNGASGHPRFGMPLNMPKQYNQQNHHHQQHHNQQHQDHTGHGGHGGNYGHQHQISSGGLSNATPHFTPSHLHANGTPNNVGGGLSKPPNEHWQAQLQLAQQEREMTMGHSHARNDPNVNANAAKRLVNGGSGSAFPKEADKEERNRAIEDSTEDGRQEQMWHSLDFSGQNLKVLAPALFQYTFLTRLFINANKLTYLPSMIGRLRNLTQLDASLNQLRSLPPEVGMLTNLRQFYLVDNQLDDLPYEMGSMYQLEMLAIEGNPLREELKSIVVEHGTAELIRTLREQSIPPEPPQDRDWVVLLEGDQRNEDMFSVFSYNTLCDKYATQSQYGYTPSEALAWTHRKGLILEEVRQRNADIVCLQEVDQESYNQYFRAELAHNDYKGVFWPKSRAKTMHERDAKLVDGCATFYKNARYILLDKQVIDFGNMAINRPDMKGEHDIFNRVMPRDDIAVVAFLENRATGARLIVVNAHIFWNPAFRDVKVIQVAILMEQLTKLADKYAKWPACTDKALYKYANGDREDGEPDVPEDASEPAPSMEYASGAQIPLILCGDFNSTPDSGVHDLIANGALSNSHPDLMTHKYGNFTRDGMTHPFSLRSSYSNIGELSFTNYTPGFTGVIDYIWYASNALDVLGLLGEVDKEYLQRVPGFPNYHFPSDHLALFCQFAVKRHAAAREADFGDTGSSNNRDRGSRSASQR